MINPTQLMAFGEVRTLVPFRSMTSFRIGGIADVVIEPTDANAFIELMRFIESQSVPFKILGNGSNLLASDDAYHGIVIRLRDGFNQCRFDGTHIVAEAGVSLIALAHLCVERGLSGLEFISGIPGTLGGALYMNAGAYQRCIYDLVESVHVYETGQCRWILASELKHDYRYSSFMDHPEWIILAARLKVSTGDPAESRRLMKDRLERRRTSQPLEWPSAGSVFRNPVGQFAWRLIEESGLRGTRIGDAQISLKHANFIVNLGEAKAQDVLDLIRLTQETVYNKTGVRLKPEIELFNFTHDPNR